MKYLHLPFAALLGVALATSNGSQSMEEFDWAEIPPSRQLRYHECHRDFRCARLLLPLDWLDDSKQDTVAIAIMKLPAVVSNDDPSFGGTIIAQPGGPGQPGTDFSLRRASMLQQLVDIPGKKHYEIVSFDPRGMGQSVPKLGCFSGMAATLRAIELMANGPISLSPATLAFRLAEAKADGRQCDSVHGKFLSYVGTANVARDMLAIVDETEALRQRKILQDLQDDNGQAPLELRSAESQKDKDLPRLQYLGISYGTALGNFFASMYPGRVGRMVLDGVVDVDDYANEQLSLTDGADSDATADRFFRACYLAGPDECRLCRGEDSSGTDISRRFWTWADSLDEKPLVLTGAQGARLHMRSGDIRTCLLLVLYEYDVLRNAVVFSDAMEGRPSQLFGIIYGDLVEMIRSPSVGSDPSFDPLRILDSQSAVACLDGEDVTDRDLSYWSEYLQKQLATSKMAGAFTTSMRIPCAGWPARPNWSFKGPFRTPHPSESSGTPEAGRPLAPLLFMSNRLDPITPVRNARAMAKGHPGAGVIINESAGHCVIRGPMGKCIRNAVADYFDRGAVPSAELVCKAPASGGTD